MEAEPQIDFSIIDFPTDQLTFGTVRSLRPELFAGKTPELFDEEDNVDLTGVFELERMFALKAFASTLGLPDPEPRDFRDEMIEMLEEEYRFYNLTSGPAHTQELVRDIEAQAVSQARQFLGKGR